MIKQMINPPLQLSSPINLSKLPMAKELEFKLTKEQDWLESLLNQLNSQASGIPAEVALKQSDIQLELNLTRYHTHKLSEYLVVTGHFETIYFTNCVKSMSLMKEPLDFSINACFIGREFETEEEYQDQTEIYTQGQVRELYFFEKRKIDLSEMIHEQIALQQNPYPQRIDSIQQN